MTIFGGDNEIGHGWVNLEGGGDKIKRGRGDELQSGGNENEIQGSDLCLALTTSFCGYENEMTRLHSMFGNDDELQAATMSRWR